MPDIAFGTLTLISPAQMTEWPWRDRLAGWHQAVRNGSAHPCLFCHRLWSADSEPAPAAFIALCDDPSAPLSPICVACAGGFSDRNALMDQAAVLAKYRLWPNAAAHRVAVG
jgi:hypothetical protein